MAMTVTATMGGAAANQHIYLWIRVLTGATEAGGASAAGLNASGGTSVTASLTPNGSASLPLFAITADNWGGSYTAAANNTIDSSSADADTWGAGFGRYTGTVTGGVALTFGASGVGGGCDYSTWACYEVRSSGASTPAVDGSSPALASATGAGAQTVTSASFTPPPGSVVVAMVCAGGTGVSGSFTMAVSDTGGGLTWTQRAGTTPSADQDTFVFTATVAGAAPSPPAPVTLLAPGWFPGAQAVTAEPGGIPFAPQPGTTDATPAVIIPPFPEAAAARPPLLPPGWFPGADRVTTEPGGIPFAQQPPPADPSLAVLPPPAPDILGIADWLPLPPGWFPGASQVTTDPGSIPFFSLPQPQTPPQLPPPPPVITGLGGTGAGWFKDQNGSPRMVLGDAVWALPGNAGRWNSGNWRGDFDAYLTTRAAQGFTVAYCKPIGTVQSGNIDSNGSTFDGLYPFRGATPTTGVAGANPSTGLTDAFWQRIDYFLTAALARGITVFLNAIGYSSDFDSGPGPLAGKSNAEFQAYGTALGARYASQLNLVWMVADDYFGDNDSLISSFLTGLRSTSDTHVISIENFPESDSRQDITSGAATAWGVANAQFQFTYSYNVTYYGIEKAYSEASPIPVIQGDGYFYQGTSTYAGGSGAFAYDRAIRQDAWHAISSGARGIIHGSESTWQWQASAASASSSDWYYVNNAGNIRALMESLTGWHLLVPDTSSALVTGGRGTHASGFTSGGGGGQYEVAFTDSYVTASRTPDGSLAVIYLSHATTITVDQSKLGAGYAAYWADPITGVKTLTTSGTTYNSAAPGNNSQGDPDWVLILQGPPVAPPSAPVAPVIPLAPGWFPGADRVTSVPGGVPFAQPPADPSGVAAPAAVSPSAGLATGTGAALSPLAAIGANAALATGTGTAQPPVAAVGANAGLATGTGAAQSPLAAVGANAGLATGTGAALSPLAAIGANDSTGPALGTGTAQPPTPAVAVNAGLATGTGTALNVSATLPAPLSTFVPAPIAPLWFPGADAVITEPGGIPFLVQPRPADPVTITAPPAVNAPAGLATGTGTAQSPLAAVGANGALASGTGTAQSPVAAIVVIAAVATATGAALAAVRGLTPGLATAAGAAQSPSLAIAANALAASALAAALNATGNAQAAFTVGTLTATDTPASALTAATAPSSTLTAGTQRTGGPS